jgi:uncharacterized protein with NRDE domain
VRDFLLAATSPPDFLRELADGEDRYAGFNLLAGDGAELGWYSNRNGPPKRLPPGVYGLSNHLLDTPWPKVAEGKAALALALDAEKIDPERLFALLADTSPAADDWLPDTGIGRKRERLFSARFIRTADYGTRCSTVLLVDREGRVTFIERTFDSAPAPMREVRHAFVLAGT